MIWLLPVPDSQAALSQNSWVSSLITPTVPTDTHGALSSHPQTHPLLGLPEQKTPSWRVAATVWWCQCLWERRGWRDRCRKLWSAIILKAEEYKIGKFLVVCHWFFNSVYWLWKAVAVAEWQWQIKEVVGLKPKQQLIKFFSAAEIGRKRGTRRFLLWSSSSGGRGLSMEIGWVGGWGGG